jgi:hypothetical protein
VALARTLKVCPCLPSEAHAQSPCRQRQRSPAFYADTLGFASGNDRSQAIAVRFRSGERLRRIFVTDADAVKEYPAFAGKPIGATGTMTSSGRCRRAHDRLKAA